MRKVFLDKKVIGTQKVLVGEGTLTVDIPFIPNYIKLRYLDRDINPSIDTLTYDLIYTGNPLIPYQIIIKWSVTGGRPRRFKYTVAKLASFHNGVNK